MGEGPVPFLPGRPAAHLPGGAGPAGDAPVQQPLHGRPGQRPLVPGLGQGASSTRHCAASSRCPAFSALFSI